ncbi:MAG: glycoside hydrolase family 3 protein [Flavobacteriaceae bacterium]|nr:glycoside hydrolase family 3 protein [Flavobacteriaceae bacterium]
MKNNFCIILLFFGLMLQAQFLPKNKTEITELKAQKYADSLYSQMSMEEKIGQLYITALYTNKDESHIASVRKLVEQENIGGIILMQDDAERKIRLVNEFQQKSRIPLLIGMDAEWGLYQRLKDAHKFPWAMTLGAITDAQLIYEMAAKIAQDAKKIGIYWNFAPVVDVNTNPANPIIGNRSFGSDVQNVIEKGLAYAQGLQDNGVLAAIKHFPGHGDTDKDSHLDLPVVAHSLERLNKVELAPFKALMNKNIGGVMVAHLYTPALESQKNLPASLSHQIITEILKNQLQYKGLIITDALNMHSVSKKYPAGELDLLAFKAGNDILLFSQDVLSGKKLIKEAINKGEIPEKRLEESVKKILKTKYLLGLANFKALDFQQIQYELNNDSHRQLSEKLYANALTLIKDEKKLLPLKSEKPYYYLPLEEAEHKVFASTLAQEIDLKKISAKEIGNIPNNSVVIIGLHKDNSTAYKPYKISAQSKKIISDLAEKHQIILNVFGSPYALRDIDIKDISTILISYENNEHSLKTTAEAYLGKHKIHGKLPVLVNEQLKYGMGIELIPQKNNK